MYQDFEGTLGQRIRYYRKRAKMTQKELADFCEVSEPAIRNYELGNRVPDWEMLQTIAAGLKVSYYALAEPDISAFFGAMHIFFRSWIIIWYRRESGTFYRWRWIPGRRQEGTMRAGNGMKKHTLPGRASIRLTAMSS